MNDRSTPMEALKLPYSLQVEQAVISSVLISPEAIFEVDLTSGEFFQREHRAIWDAALSLNAERQPVDVIRVSERLRSTKKLDAAGGLEYLGDLVGMSQSAVNIRHYAAIVRGKSQERALIALGHTLSSIGYGDGESRDKLNDAEGAIGGFMQSQSSGGEKVSSITPLLRERISAMESRANNPGEVTGIKTGFTDLDRQMMGMTDGDMIIVAGRPSSGKSTLSMNIAEYVAMQDQLAIVFSIEMASFKLADRMLCSIGQIDNKRFRTGSMTNEEYDRLNTAMNKLKDKPLVIDESRSITSDQILSKARRIAFQQGFTKPSLVVLDYLTLLSDKGEGVERITKITRNLKLAAEELRCPMIVVSQLNRQLEQRPNKRPLLSDLRDSGSVEQDADVVLMMYRDEVYYPDTTNAKGMAEVIIRKARDGALGTVNLSAPLWRCRFDNTATNHIPFDHRKEQEPPIQELDF